jgi:hypothetical protein
MRAIFGTILYDRLTTWPEAAPRTRTGRTRTLGALMLTIGVIALTVAMVGHGG